MDPTQWIIRENGEIELLYRVLARLCQHRIPPDQRLGILFQAGVQDPIPGQVANQLPPDGFANQLIGELLAYAYTFRQPSYHPLERLLSFLISRYPADLSNEQEALENILSRCQTNLKALRIRNALGRIETAGRAVGTGMLIGPNLLLTGYHVFVKNDIVREASVRFGYDAKNSLGTRAPLELTFDQHGLPDFVSQNERDDFALVRLKRSIHDRGLAPEQLSSTGLKKTDTIFLFHHPKGFPASIDEGRVLQVADRRIAHTAPGKDGSSGGAIVLISEGLWRVVGIHQGEPVADAGDGAVSGVMLATIWDQLKRAIPELSGGVA